MTRGLGRGFEMNDVEIIAPSEALQQLLVQLPTVTSGPVGSFLDVRSEAEWADGAMPGFHNAPILTTAERHEVGICYKLHGQAAAIALGYQLTAPYRNDRVMRWSSLRNADQPLVVTCWRGGARSRLACEWLSEAGLPCQRVRGGYKAMRTLLRAGLEQPPALLVLSGATGTGKTRLLRALPIAKVDLEACANHRGSAFGRLGTQPSQQSFENRVALELLKPAPEFVIEDESRLIGTNELPASLKRAMYAAPVVVLEIPLLARAELIYLEYVQMPLQQGQPAEQVLQQLQSGLDRIQRKLGALRHSQLSQCLVEAMREPERFDRHECWIVPLLADYYDPRYRHAFEQRPRTVLFRGDYAACRDFLIHRAAMVARSR